MKQQILERARSTVGGFLHQQCADTTLGVLSVNPEVDGYGDEFLLNLSAQSRKVYHLGVGEVSRSSLARVNAEKPSGLYEALFGLLLSRCRSLAPGHGFRFKHSLYSLDSTVVDLCLSVFPWANFRRTKGGLKAHVALDHAGHLPAFVTVTDGRTPDIEVARTLNLPKGSIVVADRAYMDFAWINSLILCGVFLVTRLKKRVGYRVLERREVDRSQGVTSDQTIEFSSDRGRKRCPHRLRRIGYRDPETGRHYAFLTTNFALSAKTIADIYRSRWQVELFFKFIKQHLKVKSFVGTSRNAVMTQLWIAMCMYLLVCYVKFLNRKDWQLVRILRLLQLNLFERRPLDDLLGNMTGDPPTAPPQTEMKFA